MGKFPLWVKKKTKKDDNQISNNLLVNFTRAIVNGEPPYEQLNRRMHAGIKYYSENLIFGIPTTSWGRTDIELFLNSSGLKLVDLEFAGRESQKNPSFYGMVIASV